MIEQYISELLYKYDSIILPGFGAFVLEETPSTIHSVENKISPPAKYVSFDPSLKHNDGTLANYLSEKENVSFFDACSMILDFIEKTNRLFTNGENIVFNKIGTLSMTKEGVTFTPDTTINYNTDVFGMEEISSAPILQDEVKAKAQEKSIKVIPPARERIKFPKVAVWITIIVVLIGGSTAALFIIKPDFIKDFNLSAFFKAKENNDNLVKVEQPKQNIESDIKEDIRTDDTMNTDSSAIQVNKATQNILTQPSTSGKFHIISGSFRVKENAENYTLKLRQQQYDSQVIFLQEKGLYVVTYNSYATKEEAVKALAQIRNTINASAWLLNK